MRTLVAGDRSPLPGPAIPFDRSISAKPEELQAMSPLVRRVIANNGGPFTFTGTCSYVVGRGEVAIIDPGPVDPHHLQRLLDTVRNETVRHILVTHTHRDHSPGAKALKEATNARIVGCQPRPQLSTDRDAPAVEIAFDQAYAPDEILRQGDSVAGPGYTLTALETPGHTRDHLAFALDEEKALFSGDHVMAWSTTVVSPPDGSMGAYMASLRKLLGRSDAVYWPGHGGPVRSPQSFVNALLVHRQWREAAILRCLAAGDATVATILSHTYRDLAPVLRGAAAQSVLAHLVDLVERGRVVVEGPASLGAQFRPA